MEFFDFTGTDEEEKARVLDIISHESIGVEFFLEYENKCANYANSIKSSSIHVNGIISSDENFDNEQLQQQSEEESNTFNSQISNLNQSTSNNTTQQNWNLVNNPVTSSALLASGIPMPHNGTPPVVCGPPPAPYIFQPGGPYFAPHNPSMYVPPPGAIPLAAHPVNQKDLKLRTLPSNSSNITSTSSSQKFTSKISNVSGVSNCDNRNFYLPSQAYHYPDTSQIVDNNRLNSSTISLSGDGGAMMGESSAMSSNGSPVTVPQNFAHSHHPSHTYAYSHLPPPPPFFPHFSPQFYFIHPHPEAPYMTYPAPFALTSTHHQNVINPQNASSIDMAPQSLQHPSVHLQHTSTSSSATTTLSNLSSSVSASSTSIAAAYHSSQSSQSGTPTSFDQIEDPNVSSNLNSSFVYAGEVASNNAVGVSPSFNETNYLPAAVSKQVPVERNFSPNLEMIRNSPTIYQTPLAPESQVQFEARDKQNVCNSALEESDSVNKFLNNDNLPNDETPNLDISDTTNSSSPVQNKSSHYTAQSCETSQPDKNENTHDSGLLYVNSLNPSESGSNSNQSSASTWASKLFPSSADASHAKPLSTSNKIGLANGNIEENKSNLNGDGDFPEFPILKQVNNQTLRNRNRNRLTNSEVEDTSRLKIISPKDDSIALRMAKKLRETIRLKHALPTIMPCGLVNRGNWCYVNATLQALLACPPLYNLMRDIGETQGIFRHETSTPVIDNFVRYFHKFMPTDYKKQVKSAGSSAASYLEELLNSDPYEPTCIYDTLKHIGMIKNDAQRGHQEDAEEFLSSVLNGLHEEMIKLSNLLSGIENGQADRETKANGFGNSHELLDNDASFAQQEEDVPDPNDNVWHEVGTSKHKALPTRSAKVVTTSITEIFGGSTLDVRTVNKDNNSCGNRQPFFALQLDIKPPTIKTLEDAIRYQTRREMIQGYTCSKTKQIVEASSQMFLETVPPILILHLKLFDYDIETGAGRKVLKRVVFSENFEIPRECFPRNANDSRQCRRYKLLAVVYHNGSEAMKGHYITDVFHLGVNQWLRCDDASIKVISLDQVLASGDSGTMVPYLLFYRRNDTLHNSSSPNTSTVNTIASSHSAHQNGNKFKPMDNSAHHQHAEVTINTSNKFSYISRHN